VGELKGFTTQAKELEDAGLSMAAVSVDGLDSEHETTRADAIGLLDSMNFPFERGFADVAMLDKLEFFHNKLFGLNVKMPVPTSLLIDAQGRLAAVYRGPVEVDQVLADMLLLDEPTTVLRDQAAPFAGKWHDDPPRADLAGLAGIFLDQGYMRDAVRYVALIRREKSSYVANNYAQTLTDIGAAMIGLNRPAQAAAIYQGAIAANATNVKARTNLAMLLQGKNRHKEAAALLLEALQVNPNDALVYQQLGSLFLEMGQLSEGVKYLQKALAIDQGLADAHNDMGIVHAQASDLEQALTSFARAAELKPGQFEYRFNQCRVLMGLGRPGAALDELIKAVTADTQIWQRYLPAVAGLVITVASDPTSNKEDLRKAVELAKLGTKAVNSPVLLDVLGVAHAATGNYDQAIDAVKRALSTDLVDQLSPAQVESINARLLQYQRLVAASDE
jgi:tetratricopeptide (TPR) repeat protein/peroxiredoxin